MDCAKNQIAIGIILLLSFFPWAFAKEVHLDSPVGYWRTIDDATGKPKSIVQIWRTDDSVLMGRIVKVFPLTVDNQNKLCTACKGNRHNQPIVGMVVISGLTMHQNQWKSGEILDPENGHTYTCSVKLTENGKKLHVHGYLGLPVFGRSQHWERVDLMSG